MVSVVIPTYKEQDCLDLCIGSALAGQRSANEIIVVIDGTMEDNKAVIEKYRGGNGVKFLCFGQNAGMCVAQNAGVQAASRSKVLLVNDDHVFKPGWDSAAEAAYDPCGMTSFLTVSHENVWHKYMVQQDFGKSPAEFDSAGFNSFEPDVAFDPSDRWFAAFPVMMNRYRYIALGGFDVNCNAGVFADNDLFIKAKVMGMKFGVCTTTSFYHFGSVASRNCGWDRRVANHNAAREYVVRKWGRELRNEDCHYMFSKDDGVEFGSFNY